MKRLNKYLLAFMMMLGVWAGFTACTEDVNYSPAEVPGNAQVYFSADEAAVVSLKANQSSFAIPLQRFNTSGALVAEISVVDESGKFNVPSTVTFADGAATAEIIVTLDFSTIEPNKSYPVALTINTDATEYGASVLKFDVLYAPWSNWESFGKGTYTYTGYVSGTSTNKIYRKQSLLNSNLYQFKIEEWLYGVDFIFSYDDATGQVKVDNEIYIGQDNPNYGHVYVSDPVYYICTTLGKGEGFVTYDKYPCTFDKERGLFSFSLAYYVSQGNFGTDFVETFQLAGYTVYDYSMQLKYMGHYVTPDNVDNALVYIQKGKDVSKCKYVLVEGKLSDADAEAVKNGILDGSIESVEEKEGDSAYKAFPLTEMGNYTVVAVGFDSSDKAQEFGFTNFEFMPVGMSDPWVSLGYCQYTDGAFIEMYSETPEVDIPTYSVEILEHKDKQGLFRLKNAYGAGYPYNEPGDYREENVYIEINAIDPNGVYIENQLMGLDWGGGEFGLYSVAANLMAGGKTLEEVKTAGVCGTYKDNVITFPVKTLLMTLGTKAYYTNNLGLWKVDMTNLTQEPANVADYSAKSLKKAKSKHSAVASLKLPAYRILHVKGKSVSIKGGYGLAINNLKLK